MQIRSFARPAIILVLGMLIGWVVLATTMDQVFARRAPAIALWWNPNSAEANVWAADALLKAGNLPGVRSKIAKYADRSQRRQPLNPGAARLLGVVAASNGYGKRAEQLAHYSESMSRRDLATQFWLIESNVTRGDIQSTLVHYNRALQTSVSGRNVLFPILAAASNDRDVWVPLAEVLARRPQWWRPFLVELVPKSTSPDALYTFARRTGIDRRGQIDTGLLQSIEKRLVDLGAYDRSAELYNRAHGLASNAGAPLRNGNFESMAGFDPFEWNLKDEPDLAAVRQPSPIAGDGNALFLNAANGRGGDVAVQLMILQPGRYTIGAKIGGVAGDPLAYPRLVIRCAEGREIFNMSFPPERDAGVAWHNEFVVPTGCKAQRIVLQASSALDSSDMTPWIDTIAIQPQRDR